MYLTFIISIIGIVASVIQVTKEHNKTFSNTEIQGVDYIAIDILDYWD
jgi:hypothetical protein